MRLSQLDANFIYELDVKSGSFMYDNPICPSLEQAQGIMFLCPKCFVTNNGEVGTHSIICWFKDRGVPDDMDPKPGRWIPQGTGIEDLTFIGPGAASILLTGEGCGWHGFIKNGDAS